MPTHNAITIKQPRCGYEQLLQMTAQIADESNMLPFTSEDMGVQALSLQNFIHQLNGGDNSIYLAAYDEETPIGFAFLEGGRRVRTHHQATLSIGVLQQYQGSGVGTQLMRQLLCFAERSESIAKIDLEVKKENRRAIALYKHFGFVVEGMTRRALFIDGVFYDTIRMGKCIDGDIEEENHE